MEQKKKTIKPIYIVGVVLAVLLIAALVIVPGQIEKRIPARMKKPSPSVTRENLTVPSGFSNLWASITGTARNRS